MRVKTFLGAIILVALIKCAAPIPQATATPSCPSGQGCPPLALTLPPHHVLVAAAVGHYTAYESPNATPTPPGLPFATFTQSWYQANLSLAIDQKNFTTDVGYLFCEGYESFPSGPSGPTWQNILLGTDCASDKYFNITNIAQDYVDTTNTSCTGGGGSQPYDTWVLALTNNNPTPSPTGPPFVQESTPNSPVTHSAHTGNQTIAARGQKSGGVGACGGSSNNAAAWYMNLASPLTRDLAYSYAHGDANTATTGGMSAVAYGWAGSGSNPCVDHTLKDSGGHVCSEPADHLNGYAVYDLDNQTNNSQCPNANSFGGVYETDPTLNGTGQYYYMPGWEAGMFGWLAQFHHEPQAAGPHSDGYPAMTTLNGGDCNDAVQPIYDYDVSTKTQHKPWYDSIPGALGMNYESIYEDSLSNNNASCNHYNTTVEPTRQLSELWYALQSASIDYSYGHFVQFQETCRQGGTGTSSTAPPFTPMNNTGTGGCAPNCGVGFGEYLDVSSRLFTLSTSWMMWDLQHAISRWNYIGSDGAVNDGWVSEVTPETRLVLMDPVTPNSAYNTGSSSALPTGGCNNSSTGSGDGHWAISLNTGEAGGLIPFEVALSCGSMSQPGTHFYTKLPVTARQYRDCWYWDGTTQWYLGPCGDVVNWRWTASTNAGATDDYNDTQANTFADEGGALCKYTNIVTIGDGSTDASLGDISIGGKLEFNQTVQTVIRNRSAAGASTDKTPMGIDDGSHVAVGNIMVPEASGAIYLCTSLTI